MRSPSVARRRGAATVDLSFTGLGGIVRHGVGQAIAALPSQGGDGEESPGSFGHGAR